MATVEDIRIVVKAEVDAAVAKLAQLDKSAKENQSSFQKLNATFATMRDVMQGPIAAVGLATRAFGVVKAASDNMEAAFAGSEQTAAILNSTIKATGSAAGLTEKEIQDLASEFQNITKYEDDAVIGMQNVLLGFKNIKGDNFKKASLEILNMATVMNMDLTSAAQAVGKALDNPAKGLDSLSRQGFKFTDQEKEMMQAMQDAGNIAGAQKIILDELAETYGGAAEAAGNTASAMKDKLKNAIGDVNEEIGRGITTRLAPFRERWIEIAKSIGASVKAQNDFNDAMKNMKGGKATAEDELTIAKKQLDAYKESKSRLEGNVALEESLNKKIAAQEAVIAAINEQAKLRAIYGEKANQEEALLIAKAAEAEKKSKRNAEAIALVADARDDVTKAINDAALASKYHGKEMLTDKEMADLYGDAIIKVLSDTRGLVTATNALLDPLEEAQAKYQAMADNADMSAIEKEYGDAIREVNRQVELGAVSQDQATAKELAAIDKKIEAYKKLKEAGKPVAQTSVEYSSAEEATANQIAYNEVLAEGEIQMAQFNSAIMLGISLSGQLATGLEGLEGNPTGMATIGLTDLALSTVDATKKTKELTRAQEAQAAAAMSGYQSMAEDLGGALVAGEDGWRAFGKAGLNAIAGVVEAMAIESDIMIGKAIANIMLGQVWQAPGLGAAVAASAAAHGAAGAIRAIPMAEGGSGTVSKATHFVAGEAGTEEYLFAPKSKGGIEQSPIVQEIIKKQINDNTKYNHVIDKYIPMAEGGEGIVTRPTMFLAGEAGPEPFAFGGANNKRGMNMGSTIIYNTVNQNIGGSIRAERELKQLAMSGMAQAARGY